ncbi:MAG: P-loop NTPase [Acidobacteria bacterium]|nr:P-loop NTPase [Acidobacteriota bacterium]NIM60985.1 P-loop NTPase [Acidobacteriota bacterium]NIO59953.1 P-loop NTPase [Acidobacteriota bacterium]NIQ31025.1 P-loop NTPase [Acidobacteriota bacterium]NIQ86153.1 P-loop NTPase [Acidobacteriota bacterium]
MGVDRDFVLDRLKTVPYPGFTRDIVTAGVVSVVEVDDHGVVVRLDLPQASEGVEEKIRRSIVQALGPDVPSEQVRFAVSETPPSAALHVLGSRPSAAQAGSADAGLIPEVRHVVAVASGKGGVGKSTVAVNLACALARLGHTVGLLDADVYGPSIPLMLGLPGERPRLDASGKRLIPFERYGVRFMSLGFLVEPETAVIWRGPMVMKALEQLLRDVVWGALDYLVIDLPPGTGDAQLTLTQRIQLSGAVIVSTPQDVALADAVKGVAMFRKVNVPILGLVENMSFFECPHCSERTDIFAHGGARERAAALGVPFLAELGLDPELRRSGDAGAPIVDADPDSTTARVFERLATSVAGALGAAPEAAPGLVERAARKLGLKKDDG